MKRNSRTHRQSSSGAQGPRDVNSSTSTILLMRACSFLGTIRVRNSSTSVLARTSRLQNSLEWWRRSSAFKVKLFLTPQSLTARHESYSTFHDFQQWAGRPRFLCGEDSQKPTLI